MSKLVSVIVPVYNAEASLTQCIESILSQTYPDIELLLVNDGSRDESGAICDEYARKDKRVRVFHKENGGTSSARNYGLGKAAGEWILFVDSDDYVKDTYIEDFGMDEDADIYLCGYYDSLSCMVVSPREVGLYDMHSNVNSLVNDFIFRLVTCKMYRRQIIEDNNILFELNIRPSEDTLFNIAVSGFCRRVKSVGKAGYVYNSSSNDTMIRKYALSFDELSHLCRATSLAVSAAEQRLDCSFSSLYLKLRNFYYGLYVRNILRKGVMSFYRERKNFIKAYGKDYSSKIDFIRPVMWNCFLFSSVTAFLYYLLLRIK